MADLSKWPGGHKIAASIFVVESDLLVLAVLNG